MFAEVIHESALCINAAFSPDVRSAEKSGLKRQACDSDLYAKLAEAGA
jgi:hypothetical protein